MKARKKLPPKKLPPLRKLGFFERLGWHRVEDAREWSVSTGGPFSGSLDRDAGGIRVYENSNTGERAYREWHTA